MAKKRYVYDFTDYTSQFGPIPVHQDGKPKVHTWIFGGNYCRCEGKTHQGATTPHPDGSGKDDEIRAGAVIEADLTDGSYRSQQILWHLERGACHEVKSTSGEESKPAA